MNPKNPSSSPAGSLIGRKILQFFSRVEFPQFRRPAQIPGIRFVNPSDLIAVALFSAICATAIIIVISKGILEAQNPENSLFLGVAFIALLLLYRLSQTTLLRRTSESIENALDEQRQRLARKLMQLSLKDIHELDQGQLSQGLSRYYEPISQSIMPILIGFQSAILLVFITGFIFYQSFVVGIMTLVFVGFTIRYYFSREKELTRLMTLSANDEAKLRSTTNEMILGFKELKLNLDKKNGILNSVVQTSKNVSRARSATASVFGDLIILGASTSYMLGATAVFLIPVFENVNEFTLSQIVTTELFLLGPLGAFVRAAEPLSILRFSFGKIEAFEKTIDDRIATPENLSEDEAVKKLHSFKTLALNNVCYFHTRDDGQLIGIKNISIAVKSGDMIFITGGNGSGKTTLLRVMTGLYPIVDGEILLDDQKVDQTNIASYQSLFATVFADFHTFSALYGMTNEEKQSLEIHLKLVGLAGRVQLDHSYAPDQLSTGQRKRLALAIALSEDKPILILDEWAADQDPGFRGYFYEQILPSIKAAGKTLIVVTHDERYFHIADCRYHMEDGELRAVG